MKGQPIAKENLQKGDLIFFAHSGRGRISHVGIVEEVTSTGEIKFIHASTSRGVMVSSLDDSTGEENTDLRKELSQRTSIL